MPRNLKLDTLSHWSKVVISGPPEIFDQLSVFCSVEVQVVLRDQLTRFDVSAL